MEGTKLKITILGASGKTGVHVVEQALEAGYTVNALVRNGSTLAEKANLNVFVGDATSAKDVAEASQGSDAIISVLGTASTKSTLMTDAVKAVIAASEKTRVKRFILMSSFAVTGSDFRGPMKLVSGLMKNMFKDKTRSEAILRSSDLDWTIVFATGLTNQVKGSGLRVVPKTEKLSMKHKAARADVAAWMLKEAKDNVHTKAEVIISK